MSIAAVCGVLSDDSGKLYLIDNGVRGTTCTQHMIFANNKGQLVTVHAQNAPGGGRHYEMVPGHSASVPLVPWDPYSALPTVRDPRTHTPLQHALAIWTELPRVATDVMTQDVPDRWRYTTSSELLARGLSRIHTTDALQGVIMVASSPGRPAGCEVTAALTAGGKLFLWGKGAYGVLGHGGQLDVWLPKQLDMQEAFFRHVRGLGCGPPGTRFCYPPGTMNRFAGSEHGGILTSAKVAPELKIVMVACGWKHTVLCTESGRVWTFGDNMHGQLGLGPRDLRPTYHNKPQPVLALRREFITTLDSGPSHVLVANREGSVFAWGGNRVRFDGVGCANDTPRVLDSLKIHTADKGDKVMQVSAGTTHNAAVTEHGRMFTWGSFANGQLGTGLCEFPGFSLAEDGEGIPHPTTVFPPTEAICVDSATLLTERIVFGVCDETNTFALSENGHVFACGNSTGFKLGIPVDGHFLKNLRNKRGVVYREQNNYMSKTPVGISYFSKIDPAFFDRAPTEHDPADSLFLANGRTASGICGLKSLNNQVLATTTDGRMFMWGDSHSNSRALQLAVGLNIGHLFEDADNFMEPVSLSVQATPRRVMATQNSELAGLYATPPLDIVLAFAMGTHARLGTVDEVSQRKCSHFLVPDCILQVIMQQYARPFCELSPAARWHFGAGKPKGQRGGDGST